MAKTEDADLLRLGLLWLESDLQPNAEVLTQAAKIAASRIDVGLAERLARGAASARAGPDTHLRPIQFAVTSLAHTWARTRDRHTDGLARSRARRGRKGRRSGMSRMR